MTAGRLALQKNQEILIRAFAGLVGRFHGLSSRPIRIRDGTDGLLVPCGGEERMLEALVRLIGDPAMPEEMGRNARERIETLRDRERIRRVFLDKCYEIMER